MAFDARRWKAIGCVMLIYEYIRTGRQMSLPYAGSYAGYNMSNNHSTRSYEHCVPVYAITPLLTAAALASDTLLRPINPSQLLQACVSMQSTIISNIYCVTVPGPQSIMVDRFGGCPVSLSLTRRGKGLPTLSNQQVLRQPAAPAAVHTLACSLCQQKCEAAAS